MHLIQLHNYSCCATLQQQEALVILSTPCSMVFSAWSAYFIFACVRHDKATHFVAEIVKVLPHVQMVCRYEGEFRFGLAHGLGVESTWDGVIYQGEWVMGKKHGYAPKAACTVLEPTFTSLLPQPISACVSQTYSVLCALLTLFLAAFAMDLVLWSSCQQNSHLPARRLAQSELYFRFVFCLSCLLMQFSRKSTVASGCKCTAASRCTVAIIMLYNTTSASVKDRWCETATQYILNEAQHECNPCSCTKSSIAFCQCSCALDPIFPLADSKMRRAGINA